MANIQSLLNQAIQLHQAGNIKEALLLYLKVLPQQKENPQLLYFLGTAYLQQGQPKIGVEHLQRSLVLNPMNPFVYHNLGNAFQELKRLDDALTSYDKALTLKPDYPGAYNNRGNTLQDLKRLDEALASYDKALALRPDYADAYNNRGNVLQDLKRLDEALASYDKALALKPDYPGAYNNRGVVLKELKRLDEALVNYDKALKLKPDYADAYNNQGVALRELKRLEEALTSYDKALTLKPDYADAYNNQGVAFRELKRLEEALASYDKALMLKPDFADAYYNQGNALKELKRLDEALASYDKALALKPDYADAYNNRGNALQDLKRLDEALASYDKALALKPDYADAYNNRGNALRELKRLDEALASYDKALSLKPDFAFLSGMRLYTKMKLCDWASLAENIAQLTDAVSQSQPVTPPFSLLGLVDSPKLHQLASKVYAENKYPKQETLGAFNPRIPGRKIRVGYFSADFREHAVSFLIAELLEVHDRNQFEVFGFSFSNPASSPMSQRIKFGCDEFIDVRARSDREVAELSRQKRIDIAVDLGGYTKDSRPGIFAYGAAPIQVNYLGYISTLGTSYMDYIIADKIALPPETQSDYTEKVVYLPHCYQVSDSKRKISDRQFTRQELGLPETSFVFCCFNNTYKILPATFDSWLRILKAVEDSVLWLLEDNPTAAKNLNKEAEVRGIDSHRLVFAKRISAEDYLARYKVADLFLDSLPYNAGTTANDALWMGLPVLTYMGKSFVSRMAGSLLNAIRIPELITYTQGAYEAKAIELATHPDKLQDIKNKLIQNRYTTPLFNGKLFAKHLEAAYEAMLERYQAGLPPDVIEIQP